MPSMKHTSLLLRYGVAVLAVGVAFAIKLLLDPLIVQETPFLLIFGAILISAWYGGLGPGRRDASPAGTLVPNASKATTPRRSSESTSPCSSPKKT